MKDEVMFVEIDQVAIDPASSVEALREKLHGLVLYTHLLSVEGNETIKTLRELDAMGVIYSITINTKDCG